MIDTVKFVDRQLRCWPEARERYAVLNDVETRTLDIDGFTFTLQHNPARAISTAARVDAASIASRPCFLCRHNRPVAQQAIPLLDGRYELLLNPFPIFSPHFTIPATSHTPQSLAHRLDDMRQLAAMLPGMAVFFNGAKSGASAPDHFHFQAVEARCLPVLQHPVHRLPFLAVEGCPDGDDSYYNVIAWGDKIITIPRRAHRPQCYGEPGGFIVSPATIDLAGVVILPRRDDFERMEAPHLQQILKEVCYEPKR